MCSNSDSTDGNTHITTVSPASHAVTYSGVDKSVATKYEQVM